MKLGILSDIHVDINRDAGRPVMAPLKAAVRAFGLDKLIIAGDLSSDFELTLASLQEIEDDTGVEVLFVPGNHDVWNENHPELTAWETYQRLQQFAGNLANGPRQLNGDWIAIGDLGWYDYSFGSPEFSIADFDRMEIDGRHWEDKIKSVWGRPTREMHRYFYEKLKKQLQAHRARRIILVHHVLPIRRFTVQPSDREWGRQWSYLNAFLGSTAYGELALKYNVPYVICGHVHYRKQARINDTEFICNCLNYSNQWLNDDPAAEIEQIMQVIEIDPV